MTTIERRSTHNKGGCGRLPLCLLVAVVLILTAAFRHSSSKGDEVTDRTKTQRVGGATVVVKQGANHQARDEESEASKVDSGSQNDESDDSEDGVVVTFEEDEKPKDKQGVVAFGRPLSTPDKPQPAPLRGYQKTGGHMPKEPISGRTRWNSVNLEQCLKKGEPDYPKQDWKRRTPHFLTLGNHKCGTQALTKYLWQHPQIAQTSRSELFFFVNEAFKFVSVNGIDRPMGRDLYQEELLKLMPRDISKTIKSKASKMITFDSTPRYFLDADRNPHMIMCLVPWAKLLVLFRNPVDRVESHYNYLNQARVRNRKAMVDWEVWINDDLQSLRAAGVIAADRTAEQAKDFRGSAEEVAAWKNYTRARNSQFVLGRGLYSIQLRQWYSVMEKFGKDRSELLAIQSEKLKKDTQGEYSKILDFLGLDDHTLGKFESKAVHTTKEAEHVPMPESVRRDLEVFYAPYNKELYRMLGDGWDGAWDS